MKLGILASGFPRFRGDIFGNFIFDLSRGLVEKGVHVTVLAPQDPDYPNHSYFDGVEVIRFPYFYPRSLQRLCYGNGVSGNLRNHPYLFSQLPFFAFSEIYHLWKLVRQRDLDVINTHWIIPQGLVGALLSRWLGIPHLATVHAAGLFALKNLPKILAQPTARFIVGHSDVVFLVSRYNAQVLEEIAGQAFNGIVLPMGVDIPSDENLVEPDEMRKKLGLEGRRVVLFAGRFVEKKGLNHLIAAMEKVATEIPSSAVLLVGSGDLEGKLRNQVACAGIQDYVHFHPFVPKEKLPSFLSIADLVVVPSILDESGETEGMPVLVLDAMAAGKPVLGSWIAGIPDIIEDGKNGFLVPPADTETLAKKIIEVLRGGKWVELRANARTTAEAYSWPRIVDRYYQVAIESIERRKVGRN